MHATLYESQFCGGTIVPRAEEGRELISSHGSSGATRELRAPTLLHQQSSHTQHAHHTHHTWGEGGGGDTEGQTETERDSPARTMAASIPPEMPYSTE